MIPYEDLMIIGLAVIVGIVLSKKLTQMGVGQGDSTMVSATKNSTPAVVYANPIEQYLREKYPNAM